jgi:dipeptide transport system substrate-binding protein
VKVDSGVNGFRLPRDFNAEDVPFGFNRQWRANHP